MVGPVRPLAKGPQGLLNKMDAAGNAIAPVSTAEAAFGSPTPVPAMSPLLPRSQRPPPPPHRAVVPAPSLQSRLAGVGRGVQSSLSSPAPMNVVAKREAAPPAGPSAAQAPQAPQPPTVVGAPARPIPTTRVGEVDRASDVAAPRVLTLEDFMTIGKRRYDELRAGGLSESDARLQLTSDMQQLAGAQALGTAALTDRLNVAGARTKAAGTASGIERNDLKNALETEIQPFKLQESQMNAAESLANTMESSTPKPGANRRWTIQPRSFTPYGSPDKGTLGGEFGPQNMPRRGGGGGGGGKTSGIDGDGEISEMRWGVNFLRTNAGAPKVPTPEKFAVNLDGLERLLTLDPEDKLPKSGLNPAEYKRTWQIYSDIKGGKLTPEEETAAYDEAFGFAEAAAKRELPRYAEVGENKGKTPEKLGEKAGRVADKNKRDTERDAGRAEARRNATLGAEATYKGKVAEVKAKIRGYREKADAGAAKVYDPKNYAKFKDSATGQAYANQRAFMAALEPGGAMARARDADADARYEKLAEQARADRNVLVPLAARAYPDAADVEVYVNEDLGTGAPGPSETSPGQFPAPGQSSDPLQDLFDKIQAQPWPASKKKRVFATSAAKLRR